MSTTEFIVKGVRASVEGKEILKGLDLEIRGGEIHAIMGPNGTGKSTLASALMGHPKYEITAGEVTFNGEDLLEMEVDERSRAGLFLAMQYPAEITGVTNSDFLRSAYYRRSRQHCWRIPARCRPERYVPVWRHAHHQCHAARARNRTASW